MFIAVVVVGLFFPQRKSLGFDPRESTPGFKRQSIILNAETRSLKRAAIVMDRVIGLKVSTNTIERICLEAGNDLEAAEQAHWKTVLTGEVPIPELAVIEFDGGRIRTRRTGCGPGVHLSAKGWNETKNAIFVSASSETSKLDPAPEPPACFLDPGHVAKLSEKTNTPEKQASNDDLNDSQEDQESPQVEGQSKHKPKRILRTVISSMKNSKEFGKQMEREANRRRFGCATRKAYVADGLTCNWKIHQKHFKDYVPILDFTHAVSYLFTASLICFGKGDEAWQAYCQWMKTTWKGNTSEVIDQLREHQRRIGLPDEDADEDEPAEQLRRVIGYLENNRSRMHYDQYRCEGLPTTSAWMESAVKEINYRVKGTEMFWNNPTGAEAILQIRSAALSDDDRLLRFLTRRPGFDKIRTRTSTPIQKLTA